MSTSYEELQAIGKGAADSIADMVAALECDYDRLEELREMRSEYQERDKTEPLTESWAQANPDEAEELAELEEAAGDCESQDDASDRITQDPLSIELSGTWTPGGTPKADKAIILLGTGGPATRIVCELDDDMQPHRAWIEAQDWGTVWTECFNCIEQETLLTYCQQFYYGEG
jgi:hypothetical protein